LETEIIDIFALDACHGTSRIVNKFLAKKMSLHLMNTNPHVSLLAVCGSLRAQSYSTAVLRTLIDHVSDNVRVEQVAISSLPFYNQDLDDEQTRPVAVTVFKERIRECDGLLVVTPEYNNGLPAVLKNAIDWASRPAYDSVLKDKPVACITASPSLYGGVRAHVHLQQLFASTLSRQIIMPPVALGGIGGKVVNGILSDGISLDLAIGALQRLVEFVRQERQS
jgi:chromate reductase, NAD(P)H dehydrogenase (quinone)